MDERNLDGIYFRIKRGDGYRNVCLSDMQEPEIEEVCKDRPPVWYVKVIKHLCNVIKELGDQYDLVGE